MRFGLMTMVLSLLAGCTVRSVPEGYARTADPSVMVLVLLVGLGDELGKAEVVSESDQEVVVRATVQEEGRTKPGAGVYLEAQVRLAMPLGQRIVRDESGALTPEKPR